MDKPLKTKTLAQHPNHPDVTWVFDLDNTLYHADCNLFGRIDVKMGEYLAHFLKVDQTEARRIQKDYFKRFGTTLNGLIKLHGADPEDFLHFVHDIDLSPIRENPDLKGLLRRLSGKKYVFTNGDVPYALRVLEKIGISDEFDGIFDIAQAGYIPKPAPETYQTFVKRFGLDPERAIMFEDMARNLIPASQMGMTTVWIKNASEWGDLDHEPEHVHYEAEHVIDWFDRHLEKAA